MRWRGVCRLSVCVCVSVCLSVNIFAGIATTTPKIARSLPNLHRMVITWARIHVVLKVEVKVKGHVIGALLCRSRKSLLVAGKWPDCDQTCTRWSPSQRVYRMCPVSRSRSKVTWYGHFCAPPKIAFSRRQMARLRPNLHTMVYRSACIQDVLKVKVKGHVIQALLCRARKSLVLAGK